MQGLANGGFRVETHAPHAVVSPHTPRERILDAAGELLRSGGRDALSSRAVSAVAGVQAPAIYRVFGDMNGLLDAVAEREYRAFIARRSGLPRSDDPVVDIRNGWDLHVDLGLSEPELYSLIYAEPRAGETRPALSAVSGNLRRTVHRIAEAGRLRTTEERAAHLVHSANRGLILTLIPIPVDERDLALSDIARDSVVSAIITDAPSRSAVGAVGAAVALRAVLGQVSVLTPVERDLLAEWLDRIAAETS